MKAQIQQAIKEIAPLYNEVTTSDLQGICEARAWKIIQVVEPSRRFSDCFWDRMSISEEILTGIYREKEIKEYIARANFINCPDRTSNAIENMAENSKT